jgi:O-antigen ligase/Flp pilus assembly protein TadD
MKFYSILAWPRVKSYAIILAMQLIKTLRTSIIVGLFATPFIPLIVSGSLFFPYITGKAFTFRILVGILVALWLLLVLVDKEARPKQTWLLYAATAVIGVLTLATIFSQNPYQSFWSNFERMEGLVTHLHLFAYFVIAGSVLTRRLWYWLFNVSLGVSAWLFITAAVKLANGGYARIDLTFGNSTYLAAYTLFHIFLALYLGWRHRTTLWLWVYAALAAMNLFVLYFTATRGTILGLLAGLFVSCALIAAVGQGKPRRYATYGVAGVLAIVILFVALKDTDPIQSNPVLKRFADISLTEQTTESRFLVWQMSAQGFMDRPVLGWGPENYPLVFSKYVHPKMWKQEPWFDRSHNVVFDWLISAGAVGLLAYLSLFAAAFYYLWRGQRRRKEQNFIDFDPVERAVLSGLLIAYFVHNLFVFDNLTSYLLFFAVLAYIHRRAADELPVKIFAETQPVISGQSSVYSSGAIIAILMLVLVYQVNVPNMRAASSMVAALKTQDPAARYEVIDQVLSANTFGRPEVLTRLLYETSFAVITSNQVSDQVKGQYASRLVDEFKHQVERTPGDAKYSLFLGSFLNNTGQSEEAIVYLELARSYSPHKQHILFELGSAYLKLGQEEKALAILQEAFESAEDNDQARRLLAAALIYAGKSQLADELLASLSGLALADDALINAYAHVKQYDKIAELWQIKVAASPDNIQYRFSLAAAHAFAGDNAQAIATIREAIKIDPQALDQGNYFIREIQAGRLTQP